MTKARDLANTANSGQLAGMRNKIINGKMEIAQRGTSFAAATSLTLDRWQIGLSASAVLTASQQSDVPSSNEFQNSLRIAVTTADTSIAAGDVANINHKIEGYNARDLIGKTFTLSFWVRSAKTGIHCVSFRNGGDDRSYVAEYTISVANTWEQKSITVSGGLITAGTWDWTNGRGLHVAWSLAAGSTYQTTAGAWQAGLLLATANQVNCLDTIGNIFAITGVQLEVGSVATPFEHRPFGAELALCQRYFEKSYNIDVAPGAASLIGLVYGPTITTAVSQYAAWNANFKVAKRAVPTVSYYGADGTSGYFSILTGGGLARTNAYGGLQQLTAAMNSCEFIALPGAGNMPMLHWTASAEL